MNRYSTSNYNEMVTSTYPDIFRMLSLCNPHHPQELVNVITTVTNNSTKYDENIVHIQRQHNVIRCSLIGRHRLANLGIGNYI